MGIYSRERQKDIYVATRNIPRKGRGITHWLFSVAYGDLTNDSTEDAIVILDVTVKGGSAAPNIVYLYSFVEGAPPKLLWAFSTGDRRDGGLRRVYSETGKLIVELYGKDKIIGTDLYSDDGTQAETPFPYYYTRVRYTWNGSKFQRQEPVENVSDPKDYGIPIIASFSQCKVSLINPQNDAGYCLGQRAIARRRSPL